MSCESFSSAADSKKDQSEDNSIDDFRNQTTHLVKCILELKDSCDLKLIQKWHNVFCKASREELHARNQLCAMLIEQLEKNGQLSIEFRDETNCNLNLNRLLSQLVNRENGDRRLEVLELQRQAEALQIKLDKQSEMIKNLEFKFVKHEQMMTEIQQSIEDSMGNAIEGFRVYLQRRSMRRDQQLKSLSSILSDKYLDSDALKAIGKMDEQLFKSFRKFAKKLYLKTQTISVQDALKENECLFRNLQKVYESRLNVQNWVHDVRLRSVRRQFLSNLRIYLMKFKNDCRELDSPHFAREQDIINREYETIFARVEAAESFCSIGL